MIDTLHARGPVTSRPHAHPPPPHTVLPPVARLIAIGDLHGDLDKARRAFRLADLVDDRDQWIGGSTVAVQVGDVLDRGDQEIELFYWLERLRREAAAAGGALHMLLGNHETMNVAQQFRYVTPGGFASFRTWARGHAFEAGLKGLCNCQRGTDLQKALGLSTLAEQDAVSARTEALRPGGIISTRFIAPHPVVLQIGSTVFVHGGLLPAHAAYGIERINNETQQWVLAGPTHAKPHFLSGRDAVVWSRQYSAEDGSQCDCDALQQALARLPGAVRMVVGHTIQSAGINSACGGRVVRIDVGLSKGCGDGVPQILEILNDGDVRRIVETSAHVNPVHDGQPHATPS